MPLLFETFFSQPFAKSYILVVFVSSDDLLRRRTIIIVVVKPHDNINIDLLSSLTIWQNIVIFLLRLILSYQGGSVQKIKSVVSCHR